MDNIDIRMRVALRIKQLRAERNVSQDKLAYAIGMSRSYLAEVETGRRNISMINLERVCGGLGVSLEQFFSDELFALPPRA